MPRFAIAALAFGLAVSPALAGDKIRLQVPIPLAEGHDIDDEIISHCGVPEEFTRRLTRELRRVAVPEQAPITDMAGRVLKVEIVAGISAQSTRDRVQDCRSGRTTTGSSKVPALT